MIKIHESCPYPLRPLDDVVEVLDGRRKPVNSQERANRIGPYPYYGANGQVGTIDDYLFDEELVLVAEDGGFFYDDHKPISYRVSGKCWVNNHAHVLRPKDIIDVDWLNLGLAYQDITDLIKGATRAKLNQKELRRIRVPLPPIEEQRRIVGRIKEMFKRVDEITALRDQTVPEASALLASVLNEAFVQLLNKYPTHSIGEVADETRYGTSLRCTTSADGTPVLRIPNVAKVITLQRELAASQAETKHMREAILRKAFAGEL